MTPHSRISSVPMALGLKQHVIRHAKRLWCPLALDRVRAAPIYVFPDQVLFDSDDVEQLSHAVLRGPLRLPHAEVMFEIVPASPQGGQIVAYAEAGPEHVEAYLFRYIAERGIWSDIQAQARFLPDGVAEVEAHPRLASTDEAGSYFQALTGAVWRALGLLAADCDFESRSLSPLRRRKFTKSGIQGWTYRVAAIDPSKMATTVARLGGTHASPRWHIRRGHWRTLRDGRRVFVRECQVGDASRGGVVKDYQVQFGEAA